MSVRLRVNTTANTAELNVPVVTTRRNRRTVAVAPPCSRWAPNVPASTAANVPPVRAAKAALSAESWMATVTDVPTTESTCR